MLEQILSEIHNWFQRDIFPGTYTIQDGGIVLPFLRDGQYFRILGSVFNDGLHRYGPDMELLQDAFSIKESCCTGRVVLDRRCTVH